MPPRNSVTGCPGAIRTIVIAAILFVLIDSFVREKTFWQIVPVALAGIGILQFLWSWLVQWMTEIAVTNRRVIYKFGFIFRNTKEMQMDKVESVEVDQSIFGRILNYGNVSVLGTGQGQFTRIKTIAAPLDLRNQITGV